MEIDEGNVDADASYFARKLRMETCSRRLIGLKTGADCDFGRGSALARGLKAIQCEASCFLPSLVTKAGFSSLSSISVSCFSFLSLLALKAAPPSGTWMRPRGFESPLVHLPGLPGHCGSRLCLGAGIVLTSWEESSASTRLYDDSKTDCLS